MPAPPDRMAFVDYFKLHGRHPIVVKDVVWFERAPGFYCAFPFHDIRLADDIALPALFRHPRVLAARYAQRPMLAGEGRSHLWVRRRPYSLDELSANTRSKIRRGLRNVQIERVEFRSLRERGFALIESTAARQRVGIRARHRASWERTWSASEQFSFIEAWGGFVGRELAVFSVCFQVEACFQIWMLRSDSTQLGRYPNNAMVHTLMEEGFRRPGVSCVCYGFASLDRATTGLDEFKRSAGFDPEPVHEVIVGRLPILALRAGAAALERVSTKRHGLGQAASVARSAEWWRTRTSSRQP
jgi:hypothetical protein